MSEEHLGRSPCRTQAVLLVLVDLRGAARSYGFGVSGIPHEVLGHLHVLLNGAGLCEPQRVQMILHPHTHHVHHLHHRGQRSDNTARDILNTLII